ncbi:unnamed protein product [Blepharisma stoltei]|uniref:CCHC-type domain-containing protein n=1 Tax=Blepharisma stoltei TaxID=1481888 RepID=A0AAU9J3V0_9CILI|nr:unnamed protein product [Blepharisma stoltei]
MLSYRTTLEYSTNESTMSTHFLSKTISVPSIRKRKVNLATSRSTRKIKPLITYEFCNKIRNRKSREDIQVTPEIALEVIRKYLLPMFEADCRNVAAKRRPSVYGVTSSTEKGTYDGIKLSDIIGKELRSINKNLSELKSKWQMTEAEKLRIKEEINEYQERLITSRCTLAALRCQISTGVQSMEKAEKNTNFIIEQVAEYQRLKEIKDSERNLLGQLLSNERTRNASLDNKSNELLHWYSLLEMQSDIMGERLKGLYEASLSLNGPVNSRDAIHDENDILKQKSVELCLYTIENEDIAEITLTKYIEYITQNHVFSMKRTDYREEVKSLKNHIKDVLHQKSKQISQAKDERDFLESKYQDLEKKYDELNEGYAKLRQQAREINSKRKLNGLDEEKLCKFCNKNYYERDNFNWSCCLHPGKWNGTMYWCCGKSKEDAPGCVRSKHEMKDESEEEVNPEEKDQKSSKKKCPSCRQIGHSAFQCPKDPNARSHADANEEIERIRQFKKTRTKLGNTSLEVSTKLISMLNPRLGDKTDSIEVDNKTEFISDFEDIERIRDVAVVKNNVDITAIARASLNSYSRRSQRRKSTVMKSRDGAPIDESISELYSTARNQIIS